MGGFRREKNYREWSARILMLFINLFMAVVSLSYPHKMLDPLLVLHTIARTEQTQLHHRNHYRKCTQHRIVRPTKPLH